MELEKIPARFSVEDSGICRKRLTITVAAAEVEANFQRLLAELRPQVHLKGFRPGQVPNPVLERRFGPQLLQDLKVKLIPGAMLHVLEELGLAVVGQPEIEGGKNQPAEEKSADFGPELKRGEDYSFVAQVEVRPSFALGPYKRLKVQQPEMEVGEAQVQAELEREAAAQGRLEELEGASAQDRDVLVVHGAITVEGEKVWEGADKTLVLVPDGVVGPVPANLPREAVAGKSKGDSITVEAALDERFPRPEYRGKPAQVTLTVEALRRRIPAPIDEALAARAGFGSLAEMKSTLREELRAQQQEEAQRTLRDAVVDQLIANTPFELPQKLLKNFTDALSLRQRHILSRLGLSGEELDRQEAGLDQAATREAEREIRRLLIFDEIARAEGIEVSEEELDEEIEKIARQQKRRVNEVYLEYDENEGGEEAHRKRELLLTELRHRRVLDLVVREADIVVVPPGHEEEQPPEPGGAGGQEKSTPPQESEQDGHGMDAQDH